MSGMHLLPVYYTSTDQGLERRNVKTAAMQKAEQEHQKFLKAHGVYTLPKRRDNFKPLKLEKLWTNYDNRVTIPTSDKVGNGLKTSRPTYTGSRYWTGV